MITDGLTYDMINKINVLLKRIRKPLTDDYDSDFDYTSIKN